MKTAIIIDDNKIEYWQLQALVECKKNINCCLILNCQNTTYQKYYYKNFFYYLFNYLFFKNKYRSKINIQNNIFLRIITTIDFKSNYHNQWQSLPTEIIELLKKNKISTIIKFGMGLLWINKSYENIDILSYHHGDPAYFRGKAPCFYEILLNFNYQGVIVQKINNNIDRGEILSEAKCKIYKNSYKRSLNNCYYNSIYILNQAILNLKKEKKINKKFSNNIYTLPSNPLFLKFLLKLLFNVLNKIYFYLFFYRKWRIGNSKYLNIFTDITLNKININTKEHLFFADPFFINEDQILFEGYNFIKSKGEILEMNTKNNDIKVVSHLNIHLSYPSLIKKNKDIFVLPEISKSDVPLFFNFNSNKLTYLDSIKIKGLEKFKILDPTYLFHNKINYIFCNLKNKPKEQLYIFYSNNFLGKYNSHKLNPVIIDINKSRMGGNFIIEQGRTYRIGQNNSNEYGDGIVFNEIILLDKNNYIEKEVKIFNFNSKYGPHTYNVYNNKCVYDYYEIVFSFYSFIYRLNAFIRKVL